MSSEDKGKAGQSPIDQQGADFYGGGSAEDFTKVSSHDSDKPAHESGDRRMSKEWDASKVPPSRFQKRQGSIFSTASSRDSHVTRRDRDAEYHEKLKQKGWV
ncbi:hypothetical protein FQN57_003258 [Myotisia sp. PD_48]|nr:hypothetical protein FQN57_003258 [Myotisia sp. PD_48]